MRKVILALLLAVFVLFTGLTIWMQFNPEIQSQVNAETSENSATPASSENNATKSEGEQSGPKLSLWQRIVALFGGKPKDKGYGFGYGECARWGVANKCKVKD